MIDPPQIVTTSRVETAAIRLRIPRAQIQHVMGPGLQELMGTLAAQGIKPTAPWCSHHFRMSPEEFDFEIAVPVDRPVTPAGRVVPSELPATTVARTIYQGGYEGLGAAWGEFMGWIAGAGRVAGPSLWEVYLTNPHESPDPASYRTELNRPLVP